MSILERLSKEEIDQLLNELKIKGYDVKEQDKSKILKQEAREVYGCEIYASDELCHAIYAIADSVTDNYEKKGRTTHKKKTVTADIIDEYRKIVRELLIVLKPYFGTVQGLRKLRELKDGDQ